MDPLVEIKTVPGQDGVWLTSGNIKPVWFEFEHLAITYAENACPGREIVVYGADGALKQK